MLKVATDTFIETLQMHMTFIKDQLVIIKTHTTNNAHKLCTETLAVFTVAYYSYYVFMQYAYCAQKMSSRQHA